MRLAYAEKCADKSAALKREAALKKLPKAEKEALAEKWAADNKITLRMATPDDAAAVCALYNWYVRHGVQTFQYTPSTVEEYRENIAHTLTALSPIIHLWQSSARPTPGTLRRRPTVRRTASARAWAGGSTRVDRSAEKAWVL